MYVVTMLAILVTMALALLRARMGPSVFDRVLALNMFGTKTVLLIAVIGFMNDRPEFLDIGLLYALMNFIGMVALLRFSKYGHFGEAELPAAPAPVADTPTSNGPTAAP